MRIEDLKDLLNVKENAECFVLEPDHSLQVVRKLEQKYGVCYEEAKNLDWIPRRDLALWEHSLAIIKLACSYDTAKGL